MRPAERDLQAWSEGSVRTIRAYCTKHRNLAERGDFSLSYSSKWSDDYSCPRSTRFRGKEKRRNEFTPDEILINSLHKSAGQRLFKSDADEGREKPNLSPGSPTSCLKSDERKGRIGKRVNFYDESSFMSSKKSNPFFDSSEGSTISIAATPSESQIDRRLKLLKASIDRRKASNDEDVRDLRDRSRRIVTPTDSSSDEDSTVSERSRIRITQSPKNSDDSSPLSDKSSPAVQNLVHLSRNSECRMAAEREHRRPRPELDAQLSHDNFESDERRMLEDLSRLSLNSSSCGSRLPNPRIVKARNARHGPKVKRMLLYPPESQCGEPLTLYKKWSNTDCHIRGDPENGFRYKVYYVQKFESEPWFPDDKTGSPFHRAEDCDYSTTDYG